jgi:hypothetical protein
MLADSTGASISPAEAALRGDSRTTICADSDRDIMSTGPPRVGGQTTIPAYDAFHEPAESGLSKEGWTITSDPLMVQFGLLSVYIDEKESQERWVT